MIRSLARSLVLSSLFVGLLGAGIAAAEPALSTAPPASAATTASPHKHHAKVHAKKARKKPAKPRHHKKTR